MKPSVYDQVMEGREISRKADARARNAVYALAKEYKKQKDVVSNDYWLHRSVHYFKIGKGRVTIQFVGREYGNGDWGTIRFPKEMLDFAEMGSEVLAGAVACFIQAETESIENQRLKKEAKAEAAKANREAEIRENELRQLAELQAKYGVL